MHKLVVVIWNHFFRSKSAVTLLQNGFKSTVFFILHNIHTPNRPFSVRAYCEYERHRPYRGSRGGVRVDRTIQVVKSRRDDVPRQRYKNIDRLRRKATHKNLVDIKKIRTSSPLIKIQ